jgi:hypothetical protein
MRSQASQLSAILQFHFLEMFPLGCVGRGVAGFDRGDRSDLRDRSREKSDRKCLIHHGEGAKIG